MGIGCAGRRLRRLYGLRDWDVGWARGAEVKDWEKG
jgi:hypothetical protein